MPCPECQSTEVTLIYSYPKDERVRTDVYKCDLCGHEWDHVPMASEDTLYTCNGNCIDCPNWRDEACKESPSHRRT